jgi:hypothetical protein
MPKELNIVPNERIDLDDFKYGTSTFTVDSLRDHVNRLMSGDYRGGFVLEGFRIETTNTLREIVVHNGVAIDRFGRLVTAEDDPFTKNTDLQQAYTFSETVGAPVNHFVMIEFEFADSDLKQRVVWDPTFPNPDIVDSDNDFVPAPKGKEFSIDIPVRRAKLWKIVTTSGAGTGFTDSTDPNTLRIPIAIIPVTTDALGGIDIPVADTEKPRTTVMEKPGTDNQSDLVVANSRVIQDNDSIKILNYRTGTPRTFTVGGVPGIEDIPYAFNDRDNNELSALSVGGGMLDVEIGDIIVNASDPTLNFLKEGCRYDCRPMFFSFTDPTSATAEPLSDPEQETRNMRFLSGESLLRHTNIGTAPWNTETGYPSSTATYQRVVEEFPERAEDRLKQKQDFFRALAAIVREMKYGEETDIANNHAVSAGIAYGTTTETNTESKFGLLIANGSIPEGEITTSLIGSIIVCTAGAAVGERKEIKSVSAPTNATATHQQYIVETTPFSVPITPGAFEFSIEKRIDKTTKYVDNYRTGTLNEVYRARIDRISNTWSNDLQERLRINKIPIVTVGDGYKSFGDYNGNQGLEQAFSDVAVLGDGGIIYVKRGNYSLAAAGPVVIKSNTVVMGEGPGITNIVFGDESTYFSFDPELGLLSTKIENIIFKDISITAADVADVTIAGKGKIFQHVGWAIPLENFQLDNVHFKGGSVYLATGASPGLTYRYIGDILSNGNFKANKNIVFKDSIFSVEGGGFNLVSCRNVKIQNCTFQSENDDFAFVGMSEGIVLDGNDPWGPGGAFYGSTTTALALGEVSISDCKFLGTQTAMAPFSVPTRGWIFATPEYEGSPVSVNNCQFIGDRVGLNNPGVVGERPITHADSRAGAAIHFASISELLVKGCLIHTHLYGVVAPATVATIESTDFFENTWGVVLGNDSTSSLWNYSGLGAAWTLSDIADVSVLGCNFFGSGTLLSPTPSSTGFQVWKFDSTSDEKNLRVVGCTFKRIRQAFAFTGISVYTQSLAAPLVQYDNIEIKNNTFNLIFNEIIYSGDALTNPATELSRRYGIANFQYSNNSHTDCGSDLNAAGEGLINVTAKTVTIDSNTFHTSSPSNGLSGGTAANPNRIIYMEGGVGALTLTNNKFVDSYNVNGTLNTIEISVGADYQKMIISNNVISTDNAALFGGTTAVQNGILFNTYVDLDNTSYNTTTLVLTDNKFVPRNPNFVVLASQDSGAPIIGDPNKLDEQWEWSSIDAQNNYFRARVTDNTNFDDYSNNAQYPVELQGAPVVGTINVVQNFLGASANSMAFTNSFVALLDLRRCSSHSDYPHTVNISNNLFHIDEPSWGHVPTDFDMQSIIGCRISKWPSTILVSNNTFVGAPLILRYVYKSPRDGVQYINGSCKRVIDITGNTFESLSQYNLKTLVDVVPASGFEGKASRAGTSPELISAYAKLTFNDNQILGDIASLDGATLSEQSSVVRFWHLNSETIVDAATLANPALPTEEYYDEYVPAVVTGDNRGVASAGLMYDWQIQNNKLLNSFFYLDEQIGGFCLNLMVRFSAYILTTVPPAAPAYLLVWRDFNNNSSTSTHPNYGVIVVENNNKTNKSTVLNALNIFGLTNRQGMARLFLGSLRGGGTLQGLNQMTAAETPLGGGPYTNESYNYYPYTSGVVVFNNAALTIKEPHMAEASLIVQNNSGSFGALGAKSAFWGSSINL